MPEALTYPRFLPVGDTAMTVEFGDAIAPELNNAVIGLDIALAAAEPDGIIETVPTYRSLLICYDPLETSFVQLVSEVRGLLARGLPAQINETATWRVPFVSDPPFADDLPEVAHRQSLTEDEVISLFTSVEYQVYMVGFAPGMPYLGGLPDALHISRKETPRPQVPAGAVMIGGIQACIVPTIVPSAWYTLGRTPLRPFMPDRQDPFLFRPGDRVRFRRVDVGEFERLARLGTQALLSMVRAAR